MKSSPKLLLFVSIIFVAGIVFGSLAVLFMSESQRIAIENKFHLLLEFRNNTVSEVDSQKLWEGIFRYSALAFILFLLSVIVIGIPILLFYVCFKGFMLGFTTSFIIHSIGMKGIFLVILAIIPQNIILIPSLIFYSAHCVSFAKTLFFDRIIKVRGYIKPQFLFFLMSTGIFLVVLIILSFYESLLSPYVIGFAFKFIS